MTRVSCLLHSNHLVLQMSTSKLSVVLLRWILTFPKFAFPRDCEPFILSFWIQGSGTQGDRKCCKHVLSWKSNMAWEVSERSLSLEAVLVYTFALMVLQFQALQACYPSGQLLYGGSARRTSCIESSQLQLSSVIFLLVFIERV